MAIWLLFFSFLSMSDSKNTSVSKFAKDADSKPVDLNLVFNLMTQLLNKFNTMDKNTSQLISDVTKHISDLEKDIIDGSSLTSSNDKDNEKDLDYQNPFPSLLDGSSLNTDPQHTGTKPYHNAVTGKPFLTGFSTSDDDVPPKKRKTVPVNGFNDESIFSKRKRNKESKQGKSSSTRGDSSSEDDVDDIDPQMHDLMFEYQASKSKYLEDPTSPPLPDPLAKILETWFWSIYSKDEVKAELAKSVRPENAHALIPTCINETVFHAISPAGLSKDMPYRFIQNAFMKTSQPLSTSGRN